MNANNARHPNQKQFSGLLKNCIVFLLILLVVLIFWGRYTGDLQQTDTYAKWFYSISAYRGQYKTNARLGELAYMEFFYRIMGEPQHFRAFHVSVGILLDTIIVFLLWKVICTGCILRDLKWRFFALFPTILLRVNVFYSDIFQFGVDTAPMFLGDLLAIIAALFIAGKITWRYSSLIGFLFLSASLMLRQTCLFWFIFTGLLIVFFDCADSRYIIFLKKVIFLVFIAILAALPVLFLINYIAPPGSRGSFSQMDLSGAWTSFRAKFAALVCDCDGVQPRWFYSFLLGTALGLNIPIWISSFRTNGRAALLSLLAQEIIVTLGVLFGTFFTVFFEHYLPHRTVYGFATIFPLWIIFAIRSIKLNPTIKKAFFPAISSCLLLANLFVNYHYVQIIYQGMVHTNCVDQENARYYYRQILKYEEETGIVVHKLAWHFDKQYTWTLPGMIGNSALNDRAYSAPWSQREIFPFTVGRRFQIVPFDEDIYNKYFYEKNWDELSTDQILFIDDTVYIVLY